MRFWPKSRFLSLNSVNYCLSFEGRGPSIFYLFKNVTHPNIYIYNTIITIIIYVILWEINCEKNSTKDHDVGSGPENRQLFLGKKFSKLEIQEK